MEIFRERERRGEKINENFGRERRERERREERKREREKAEEVIMHTEISKEREERR